MTIKIMYFVLKKIKNELIIIINFNLTIPLFEIYLEDILILNIFKKITLPMLPGCLKYMKIFVNKSILNNTNIIYNIPLVEIIIYIK